MSSDQNLHFSSASLFGKPLRQASSSTFNAPSGAQASFVLLLELSSLSDPRCAFVVPIRRLIFRFDPLSTGCVNSPNSERPRGQLQGKQACLKPRGRVETLLPLTTSSYVKIACERRSLRLQCDLVAHWEVASEIRRYPLEYEAY